MHHSTSHTIGMQLCVLSPGKRQKYFFVCVHFLEIGIARVSPIFEVWSCLLSPERKPQFIICVSARWVSDGDNNVKIMSNSQPVCVSFLIFFALVFLRRHTKRAWKTVESVSKSQQVRL